MGRARTSRRAFTLIELLIVMVLMVMMYVMLYSPGTKAYQLHQKAACQKNLAAIYVALKIYAAENDGKFPALEGAATAEAPLSLMVPKWTTATACFTCPGSGDKLLPVGEPFAGRKISYAYYMGHKAEDGAEEPLVSDRQIDALPKARGDTVFSLTGKPPGSNHRKYGGIILFCDGRAVDFAPTSDRELPCPEKVKLLNPKN